MLVIHILVFAFLSYGQLATCNIPAHLIPGKLSNETSSNTSLSSSSFSSSSNSSSSSTPSFTTSTSIRSQSLTAQTHFAISSVPVASVSNLSPPNRISSRTSSISLSLSSTISPTTSFSTTGHSSTYKNYPSVSPIAVAASDNLSSPNHVSSRVSSSLFSNSSSEKSTGSTHEPNNSPASKATSKDPSSSTHKSKPSSKSKGSSSSHVSSKHTNYTFSTSKSSKGTSKKKPTIHIPGTGWAGGWTSTKTWTCEGKDKVRIYTSHDDYCRISVNTVQLHYWPTGTITDGLKYPATRTLSYNNKNLTMVSPSIYYVIDKMFVVDPCALPITSRGSLINFMTSYRLDEVSTKQPYKNGAKSRSGVRIGPDKQLELSDLRTDCATRKAMPPERNFVVESNYNGACEPLLVWRDDMMTLQNNEVDWSNCGRVFGGNFGFFDPPVPVAPCTVGDCANQGADNAGLRPPSPTTPAASQGTTSAIASPAQALPASGPTATPKGVISPQDLGSKPVYPASNNPTPQSDPASNNPPPTNPSNIPAEKNQPVTVVIPLDNSYATVPAQPQGPATPSIPPKGASDLAPKNPNLPLPTPAPTPILIATLGNGNVVSANHGASSVVVGSETISAGGTAITIQNIGIVSLLQSGGGMVVNNNDAVTTYTYGNNVAPPESLIAVTIGTLAGGSVISAIPGASTLVVGMQTLSLDEPTIKVPCQGAMSLSPAVLVVLNDGKTSTYTIPTAAPISGSSGSLLTIPSGQVITAIPGASNLSIGIQTLSVNGPVITVPGQGVMGLLPTGIVIINNVVPTAAPTPISLLTLASGRFVKVRPGVSNLIIGTQTLGVNGPAITVSGQGVMRLSPTCLVMLSSTLPTKNAGSESLLTLGSGQVITARPGASTLVIGAQTLSVNGPALTIPGQGIISLLPTGLVIINNGITTTRSLSKLQTSSPPTPQTVSMNNGDLLTVSPLGSLVVIEEKTLTQGGSITTLPGDKVVSLGPSGVVVQMPGGKATTIPVDGVVSKTVLPQSALASSATGFRTSTKTSVVGGGILVETVTVGVPATNSSVGEKINNFTSAKKGGSVGLGAIMRGSCLCSCLSVFVMIFL